MGVALVSRRRVSEEQVDRAIGLLRACATPAEAARASDMSVATLYGRLRKRGLTAEGLPGRARDQPRPRRTGSLGTRRERFDTVVALRERGLTFAEIGLRLGITRQGAHFLWLAAAWERAAPDEATSRSAQPSRAGPLPDG